MRRKLIIAAAIAAIFSVATWAQTGPGMMGGYGGYGPGYGTGPGMMGGYGGYGPGYGTGPGMMGGYGGYGPGYGMCPGMMGGYGGYGPGYGMGPGMMGGYGGGYGMGPGMMGGYGPGGSALKLSDDQISKIAGIQEQLWKNRWELMGKLHEQRFQLQQIFGSGNVDDAAARKFYAAMADTQKQMFEASLDARKRMDAVLTKEQREQLRLGWGSR